MVLETVVFSLFSHFTRLVAREDFIIHSRRESSRSYIKLCVSPELFIVQVNISLGNNENSLVSGFVPIFFNLELRARPHRTGFDRMCAS
jgi:hypothetical protein